MCKKKNSLIMVLGIYLVCFVLRILEYFVLRTDQTFWGEAFVHKLLGIGILFVVAKGVGVKGSELGFSREKILRNLWNGFLFGIIVFAIAYGTEIIITVSRGEFEALRLYVSAYAVDKNIGQQTSLLFFLICIVGNVINVVMEEGIFRGLFQQILQKKYSFMLSAIIVSILFGLWHVMGPIRNYYDGTSSLGGFIANMLMLVVTSGLVGFKFALLTKMTGSLYMAMSNHFVNNALVNVLHVVSKTGADQWMFVRITIAQSVSFIIVLIAYLYTRYVKHEKVERDE